MPNVLNKGAGSEASLPVTLRFLRSAPKLLFPTSMLCRARWARPNCWSFRHSCAVNQECFFPNAGISPLRRRQGGFAVAPLTPSHCTPMLLDFHCCRGNRLCGGDQRAFRSPFGNLRGAHPCLLTFIEAGRIAPAGATREISNRSLSPFGAATLVRVPCLVLTAAKISLCT